MSVADETTAPAGEAAGAPLLEVRNLKTYFPVRAGGLGQSKWLKAVDDVSLSVEPGQTIGIVGESGCGKSTLGRSILRLVAPQSGEIVFDGEDVLAAAPARLTALRRHMQMIFQDPLGCLDPRMSVEAIIGEGLLIHGVPRAQRRERVRELIEVVGLNAAHLDRYPHEFSGGQRQRIGIARALALRPKLIVADEPVSALDVSVQSQVLNLLRDVQQEFGLTYVFIAHDLAVVEYISDRVAVMYLGKIVEFARSADLFADPRMPYTEALLSAIPGGGPARKAKRIILKGDVPSPVDPPSGCAFRTRCWKAQAVCAAERPVLREVRPHHHAACHFAD